LKPNPAAVGFYKLVQLASAGCIADPSAAQLGLNPDMNKSGKARTRHGAEVGETPEAFHWMQHFIAFHHAPQHRFVL
jgi:hypothetical protein